MCVCTVCASACVAEVDERKQSSGMFRQCEPSRQQAQEPSRQRPAMSVAVSCVLNPPTGVDPGYWGVLTPENM